MSDPSTSLVTHISRELMERTFKLQVTPLPFTRDLFLIETHVAGLAYYQMESVQAQLVAGLPLLLQREPGNEHDDLAIEVLTQERTKLGYVPKNRNPVLARLMDAGKYLIAEVCTVDTWEGGEGWNTPSREVRFRISLRE